MLLSKELHLKDAAVGKVEVARPTRLKWNSAEMSPLREKRPVMDPAAPWVGGFPFVWCRTPAGLLLTFSLQPAAFSPQPANNLLPTRRTAAAAASACPLSGRIYPSIGLRGETLPW